MNILGIKINIDIKHGNISGLINWVVFTKNKELMMTDKNRYPQINTIILNPHDVDDWSGQASQIVKSGGIVVFPTESSYGIAVNPFNISALSRLKILKNRPEEKTFLVLISSIDMLSELVDENSLTSEAKKLMTIFWPGSLTLVMKSQPSLSEMVVQNQTIAVRLTSNRTASQFIDALGFAVTATSANLSGQPNLYRFSDVLTTFQGKVEAIIDGGDLPLCPVSTLVDVSREEIVILRESAIKKDELFKVLNGCSK